MVVALSGLILIIASAYGALLRFAGDVFENRLWALLAAIPLALAGFAVFVSLFLLVVSTTYAAIGGFIVMAIIGGVSFRPSFFRAARSRPNGEFFILFSLWLILSIALSILIVKTLDVRADGTLGIAAGGATADTPYHLAQILRVSETTQWDFEEPNFAGEFIRYPYFINLLSGVLVKSGMPLEVAMHLPAILLGISALALLILLFRELGFSIWLTVAAVIGVIFAGGIGYISYLSDGDILQLLVRGRSQYPMQNIAYPGLVPGFIVHQRPFLFGLSLFLVSAIWLLKGIREDRKASLVIAGIAAGLLPFAHMHSFVAISTVGVAALLCLTLTKNPQGFDLVRGFGFPAALLALPQLALLVLLPKFPAGAMISARLGWMISTPGATGGIVLPPGGGTIMPAILRYWWSNFAGTLLLPLWILAGWRRAREDIVLGVLSLSALLLWVIPNLIQFQVWDFDTNKLFSYAILISIAAVGVLVQKFERWQRLAALSIFMILILVSIPSSLIASWRGIMAREPGIVLLNQDEQEIAAWLKLYTKDNAVVFSGVGLAYQAKIPQNPAVIWSGRRATSGYIVFLYTHGIDYAERTYQIEQFLTNPAKRTEEFDEVPMDFILIDDELRAKYPRLEAELARLGYQTVFSSGKLALIRISP